MGKARRCVFYTGGLLELGIALKSYYERGILHAYIYSYNVRIFQASNSIICMYIGQLSTKVDLTMHALVTDLVKGIAQGYKDRSFGNNACSLAACTHAVNYSYVIFLKSWRVQNN